MIHCSPFPFRKTILQLLKYMRSTKMVFHHIKSLKHIPTQTHLHISTFSFTIKTVIPITSNCHSLMSAVYILDNKGRVLINFDDRGEVDLSIPDKFMTHIQNNDKILPNPVFRVDDWCFAYIDRASMYFVTVTRTNSNVTLLLTFLSSLVRLFEDYLGPLSADAIVDHFSLIYELFDEVMDYGYPQTLDSAALGEYSSR
jgi:hypothetical protein